MTKFISVRGAREHNLKNVTVEIPKDQLVVITGVSGSGKSSLAFDTVYAEGQRRYVESLSAYARQFLETQKKPNVDYIGGLSPAVAINQKAGGGNLRSTVGTTTEIYDYLRLLYARIGVPYSPATGLPIEKQTPSQMIEIVSSLPHGSRINILAPIISGQKGEHRKEILAVLKQGFEQFRIDGLIYEFNELPAIDKNKKHSIEVVVDKLILSDDLGNRLADSIETALNLNNNVLHSNAGVIYVEIISLGHIDTDIGYKNGDMMVLSEKFACPVSGFSLTEIEPRIFSFNSPYGACKECEGLGVEMAFNPGLVVQNEKLSIHDGAIAPWSKYSITQGASESRFYNATVESLAEHYKFSLSTPFGQLPEHVKEVLLYGSGDEVIKFEYHDTFKASKIVQPFEGVIPYLQRKLDKTESEAVREELRNYQSMNPCKECSGYRLSQESLSVKVAGKHIGEICALTVSKAVDWFESLPDKLSEKHSQIGARVLKEIVRRLNFLKNVGLEYLTLSRGSSTLSGGESQRIRLASQIGSGLSGVIYVLDEPSIGLHQCDNEKLLKTLLDLRDLGNTVIVVEHDEDTMVASDYIIDVGPGAGIHGGMIMACGTPHEVAQNENSITGKYLLGKEYISVPTQRRKANPNKAIVVTGARANNLSNITVSIPLGLFIAITGPSGSGKSSFTIYTLYRAAVQKLHGAKAMPGEYSTITGLEYIDKVIEIDQSPIGRTPRSNPATYTGAFTPIRDWFAGLPEAKMRGYKPGRFSFNVKGGRCEACEGDGVLKIEMHFLPDVYVTCEECKGARYNKETLEILYKGKSIAQVLDMTVEDAAQFFENVPLISEKLTALQEVGLGYMQIGQSATTLSGGEAQRVKLAKELSRKSTGRTLYILDEPTTGLHSHDIKKLLQVLHTLVDAGNTVLVIEHNLDVIKTADHVIDMGPSGGDNGGKVIAYGTPESVSETNGSVTGEYLQGYLQSNRVPINKKLA